MLNNIICKFVVQLMTVVIKAYFNQQKNTQIKKKSTFCTKALKVPLNTGRIYNCVLEIVFK